MTDNLNNSITRVDPDWAFRVIGLTEATKAISAIEDVEQLFAVREKVNDFVERRENGSIFEKLRLVLTYTASTSRIFWSASSKPSVRLRCERLRDLVGIPADHALSNRTLRNHIEHFDERLDVWLGDAPRPFTGFETVVHGDMKARTTEALQASVPVLFFESDLEVRLFGHEYRLADLKAALIDVRDRISQSLTKESENPSQV